MKLQELLQYGTQILEDADIADARLDARYLLEWIIQKPHAYFLLHGAEEADSEQVQNYLSVIEQRKNHMPLQYITHEQEFMGYPFYVDCHVLIPRQDTEVLAEAVIQHLAERKGTLATGNIRILDLCCGSGCIGISLKKHLQHRQLDVEVTLSDISGEALKVAARNAEALQCDVTLLKGDLFRNVSGVYDVIVSNPPYIQRRVIDSLMPEVRQYEPRLALDGDEDGLKFYRQIIMEAGEYLKNEGYIFFEIGYNQAEQVKELLNDGGYEDIVILQDLSGLDRVAAARIGKSNRRINYV